MQWHSLHESWNSLVARFLDGGETMKLFPFPSILLGKQCVLIVVVGVVAVLDSPPWSRSGVEMVPCIACLEREAIIYM